MNEEITPADLADQVLDAMPNGSKLEWGDELRALANVNHMDDFIDRKLTEGLGQFVSSRKAALARKDQAAKALAIGYNGSALSPVLSVRSNGATTLALWVDVSPKQYVEAVLREQNVVEGRNRSNQIRLQLATQMIADDILMGLSTLREVCTAIGVDPDALGLDELSA